MVKKFVENNSLFFEEPEPDGKNSEEQIRQEKRNLENLDNTKIKRAEKKREEPLSCDLGFNLPIEKLITKAESNSLLVERIITHCSQH
jgi:hypothetical protein